MSEPTPDMPLAELVCLAAEADAQGDLPRAAAFHAYAGAEEVEAGRHDRGLEHFNRAIAAYEGSGQHDLALLMGYNRAHTLFLAERYHQSLDEYQRVEDDARAAGMTAHLTKTIMARWHVHEALGDAAGSEATLQRLRVAAYEARLLPTAAWADSTLAVIAYEAGRYDAAIAAYESARTTYTTLMIGDKVGDSELGLAAAHFRAGDRKHALAALARARERYALLGMHDRVAHCDHNRAAMTAAR